ncbi:MAG: hypothetical protein DRR06_08655 [Gammaproteobacteria bacterium]|nr:MAG: hypothetical protein DRR06_08655 [Gammaproteobacteria bacterium]
MSDNIPSKPAPENEYPNDAHKIAGDLDAHLEEKNHIDDTYDFDPYITASATISDPFSTIKSNLHAGKILQKSELTPAHTEKERYGTDSEQYSSNYDDIDEVPLDKIQNDDSDNKDQIIQSIINVTFLGGSIVSDGLKQVPSDHFSFEGLAMRLTIPLVLISVFLVGCVDIVRHDMDPETREVQSLFDQQRIDPLTRYLEKHANNPAQADHLARVRTERDRRCDEIAGRYATKSANEANLNKLKRGYAYSCSPVVEEFATRVAEAQPRIGTKAAENCYLLFSIKNYREAQAACEPPAQQGDARSQYNLGVVSSTVNDPDAALKWTKLAVAQGLPEAQLHLGRMYQKGQDVSRDDREALRWFRQAGEQGLAEAQYHAGLNYYRGEGTERDYDKARQWFARAAQQGYAAAQTQLGKMYALGKDAEVDGERAENWLKRAADQGATDAQYRLGILYTEGTIVPKNETQAYVWLSVAALAGDREAEEQRKRLAQALDPARIELAQQQIRRILEQRH